MQGFRNGNIPVASGKVIRLSEKQQFDSKSTVTFSAGHRLARQNVTHCTATLA
jgi:hypothetical protein